MTTGSSMQAMIRTAPPQAGEISISTPRNGSERRLYVRLEPLIQTDWLAAQGRQETATPRATHPHRPRLRSIQEGFITPG